MDLWPVLRFWPRRKNVRFSVPTLKFCSIVSQDHFFGDSDHLTEVASTQAHKFKRLRGHADFQNL